MRDADCLPEGYRWVTHKELIKVYHPSKYYHDELFGQYFETHALFIGGYAALPIWL